MSQRRVMTSAICNMSVAEVRKLLGECRRCHQIQTHETPLFITDTLSNGMQIQEFALRFQQGHHQKRHNKMSKNSQDNSEDESDDEFMKTYDCSDSEDQQTPAPAPSPKPKSKPPVKIQTSQTPKSVKTSTESKKRGRPKKTCPDTTEKQKVPPNGTLMDFVEASSVPQKKKTKT